MDTDVEQKVALSKPVDARYFRMIAISEQGGNPWTSAAEIGIEAESKVDAVEDTRKAFSVATKYAIQDVASGMYLYSKANSNGDFCIGDLVEDDASFQFNILSVSGHTSYYKVKTADGFMSKDPEAWMCSLGNTATSSDQWVQAMAVNDDKWMLSGVCPKTYRFETKSIVACNH